MKRKQIAALALSFVLTTGAAVLGTYSYFTAKDTTKNNISVGLGDVKIEKGDGTWQYKSDSADIKEMDLTKDLKAFNLRPGDKFEKVMTVKYTGSLTSNIKITKPADKNDIPFTLTIKGQNGVSVDPEGENIWILKNVAPNTDISFIATFEVPTSVKAGDINDNNKTLNLQEYLMLDITATQANNPGWGE